MTVLFRDMVMETTVTQGSVACVLDGAVDGYSGFAEKFPDGAELYYCRRQRGSAWEVCKGTLTHGPPVTLTRTLTLDSSIGVGVPVVWGEGDAIVYCVLPASEIEDFVAANFLLVANRLSEIAAAGAGAQAAARGNLALGSMALEGTAAWLSKAGNLAGLADVAAARGSLGLGTAATLNVGTGANQVVQLNGSGQLPAVSGALLTGLPSGPIPAGSVTDWYQAAAPSGWTRITTVNDRVCMIVSAGSPGTVSASTWDITGLSADAVGLSIGNLPSHDFTIAYGETLVQNYGGGSSALAINAIGSGSESASTNARGSGTPHGHTVSSTGVWRPPAANFLLASKN